jgi:CheY-like chemotaxis protein
MPTLTRILLVEDNLRDAEMLLSAFDECGLSRKIVLVRDGVEALDYLYRRGDYVDEPEGNPSVVLMDINMPKMGGLDVLRKMRADPRLRMVPVMLLTSSHEDRDLLEGYKLGANAFAVKSVNMEEFVEKVRRVGEFWSFVNEPPPGGRQFLDELAESEPESETETATASKKETK